ncbi:MAG: EamA family transporter [Eggerthellaceae bacterium]|nr:EamA family transporter [Eggerthellaceae bacterium]MBQ9044241.1 EamA family transporter [Eggerthellaceae bacterium]
MEARATIAYVSSLCIYGTIGWVLSFINLPSEVVVLCRGILGSLFLAVVVFVVRRRFDAATVRSKLGWLIVSGLCLGFNWVMLFEAYRVTTVAVASLCNYMAPLILVLLAPLLGEKLSAKRLACVAIAFVGMILVSGVVEGGAEGVNAWGVTLGLLAAAGFVGVVVCNRKLTEVPVYDRALVQLCAATVAALPFVIVGNWGAQLQPDALSIALVIMLGVVHTGFAYCLWFTALGALKVQSIAVLGYIEPVVSVLCSVFLLGQPLSLLGWLGAALILGAAAASELLD